jgi:NADPH:quinone reductase-like Zn-dependent oxidoreductase
LAVFPFDEAASALAHFRNGARFGKVVISHEQRSPQE